MDWSRTQLPICVFSTFRQFFTFDRYTNWTGWRNYFNLDEFDGKARKCWGTCCWAEARCVHLYSAWAAYGALWVPIPVHSGFTCSCNTSFEDGECSETSENFLPPPTLHGLQGFPGDGLRPGGTSSQFQKTQVVHVFWVTPLQSAQISRYDQRTTKKLILKTECTVCKLKTQVYFSGPLY